MHQVRICFFFFIKIKYSNLADSNARSIDGQLQRMRHSSLKLLSVLSRDDLFRHLLSQIESTQCIDKLFQQHIGEFVFIY